MASQLCQSCLGKTGQRKSCDVLTIHSGMMSFYTLLTIWGVVCHVKEHCSSTFGAFLQVIRNVVPSCSFSQRLVLLFELLCPVDASPMHSCCLGPALLWPRHACMWAAFPFTSAFVSPPHLQRRKNHHFLCATMTVIT